MVCAYFLPTLEATNTINTIIAIITKIPTPIPALKIPVATEQLVSEKAIEISSSAIGVLLFMVSTF